MYYIKNTMNKTDNFFWFSQFNIKFNRIYLYDFLRKFKKNNLLKRRFFKVKAIKVLLVILISNNYKHPNLNS